MESESRSVTLEFGLLNPPIKDQLQKQGFFLNDKHSAQCEKVREAIAMLYVLGIAMKSETDKMYNRLFKIIIKYARERKNSV